MPITTMFRQPNHSPNSRSSRYSAYPRSMRPITSIFSRIFNSLHISQSPRTNLGWNPDSQDLQTTLIPFSDTSPHPGGAGPWPANLPTPSWRALPARPPHLHEIEASVPPHQKWPCRVRHRRAAGYFAHPVPDMLARLLARPTGQAPMRQAMVRTIRTGSVISPQTIARAPSTAIPKIRNGRRHSHTKGYRTRAAIARGQHKTSRMHHRRNFSTAASPHSLYATNQSIVRSATIKNLIPCCDLRPPGSLTANAWWQR
jgi:hypothetical protein